MRTYSFLVAAIAAIMFASCDTPKYAYSPQAHNVPVLTQKGDAKAGILYSSNPSGRDIDDKEDNRKDRSNGFDIQGAYAISDNWAIQAAYARRWDRTYGGSDSSDVTYGRNMAEVGVGYYFPLTSKKTAFFQLFGGVGLGENNFTDISPSRIAYHYGKVLKVYIQPAMLFRSKGSFSTSVAIRGSLINFNSIKTSYNQAELEDFHLDVLNNRSLFFIEPGFVSSFGFKNVPGLRIEFQGGLSALLSDKELDFRPINLSVGTYLDFRSLIRRNK